MSTNHLQRFAAALAVAIVMVPFAGQSGQPAFAGDKPTPLPDAGAKIDVYGPYLIYNLATQKCVDVPGFGDGTINGPVNQYTCDGSWSDNQLWYFTHIGSGVYQIYNGIDGKCIDLPGYAVVPAGTKAAQLQSHG